MSRSWTLEEHEAVGKAMKAAGYMSYEEFCEALDNGYFTITAPSASAALADDKQAKED